MNKPLISVGIMTAKEINVQKNDDNSFTVFDVPIGINFHWERKENQTFLGTYNILENEGQKTLINQISIEDYLVSVISSEMSATSGLELLKAHAVISRTWVLAQKEKSKHLNDKEYSSVKETEDEYIRWYDREDHKQFDVCADDHCQRYQGITKAHTPAVKKAVENTAGEILTYAGEICDTRFSKCCGGKTEPFENVWEPAPHPYLKSIIDPFCNTNDEKILSQILLNYDQETGDFYRWKVAFSQDEISELIHRRSGWDFGKIIDLIPVEKGPSGRIIRLKIIGSKMSKTVGKELFIRKILSESHLYSSAFEVKKMYATEGEQNTSEAPCKFTLYGKGWGHGVGLCQIGAAMMSAKGYSYKEILQHYFPGAQLEKKY